MDALDWTPLMALEHARQFVEANEQDAIIVISLSKGEDGRQYNTSFSQAGLVMSEVIALLEIQKARMLESLRSDSGVIRESDGKDKQW